VRQQSSAPAHATQFAMSAGSPSTCTLQDRIRGGPLHDSTASFFSDYEQVALRSICACPSPHRLRTEYMPCAATITRLTTV